MINRGPVIVWLLILTVVVVLDWWLSGISRSFCSGCAGNDFCFSHIFHDVSGFFLFFRFVGAAPWLLPLIYMVILLFSYVLARSLFEVRAIFICRHLFWSDQFSTLLYQLRHDAFYLARRFGISLASYLVASRLPGFDSTANSPAVARRRKSAMASSDRYSRP